MEVKSIIFDLGGVLLDISFAKTREAFNACGVVNFDDYFHQSYANPLFSNLETGKITPEEFYENFRLETGLQLSDGMIRNNWNALLGGFRKNSVAYLQELKEKYKLFLFSNTNLIHYEAFIASFEAEFGHNGFNDFFDRAYYSHTLNLRKPAKESFLYITEENNLVPAETLFVDDSYINIEGAEAAGLQTFWLKDGLLIEDALPAFLER